MSYSNDNGATSQTYSQEKHQTWQVIAAKTRHELEAKVPNEWRLPAKAREEGRRSPMRVLNRLASLGIMAPREVTITSTTDACELLAKIHARDFSAEEVTVAFCKRAAIAHQLVNCLMDIDFENAIDRARELDVHFKTTGRVVGPLHGLPVSIKDLTSVKGLHYTMGYVSWADRISPEDAVVVANLRQAGAIIYVKTTMPQSGMCIETTSPLYGTTLNPYNVHLTSGGSSGGESALIASRGSILGIGTDSGGSIRVPAAYTGLYSLKPTSRRISYMGNNNNSSGLGGASCIGPMGVSVRDVTLATKVLIDARQWLLDPEIVEKPWTTQYFHGHKLNIGLLEWDGVVMPHPPIKRAIRSVRKKLLEAGHDVVTLSAYNHAEGRELYIRMSQTLGTTFISDELNATGEPAIPAIVRRIGTSMGSLAELERVKKLWKSYKERYLAWWMSTKDRTANKKPIDALLLPCGASASFPHNYVPLWDYVRVFNLLDYPGVTIPVTTVDKSVDIVDTTYAPISEADAASHRLYDAELFHGTPVSLQLVSRAFTEEALLDMAEIVDQVIKE